MKKFDFSGYATKNDLKCSDGRTIRKDAFKHNDGQTVPLVWQHMHNEPLNVLGHALLENREDGVYAYGTFNSTPAGQNAKELVKHGDIMRLSIYANQLKQNGGDVIHGAIREVSLVLSGANPGALIDNVAIQHSDGTYETCESEAIIYTDEEITHAEEEEEEVPGKLEHEEGSDKTVQEVFDSLTEEQKQVVYFMIGAALDDSAEHSEEDEDDDISHSDKGGKVMKKNVFDKDIEEVGDVLTHAQVLEIFKDAQECGSLKDAIAHAGATYGIENIDYLFPDAKTVTPTPEMIMRENSWVAKVMSGTYHTPFSRIKSTAADITADAARALGYVKGNLKKEEVVSLLKRVTTPTTVYKKQKLDRDDIIDITDFNVVGWLKQEMRMMLDEEIARAILVSDGRDSESTDKIPEANIRPIYKDDDMYAHKVRLASTLTNIEFIDELVKSRKYYKGTGSPTFFTTPDVLTDMLLIRDKNDRRLYNTEAELASALRVSEIVEVPVMEGLTQVVGTAPNDKTYALKGIIVNLKDYNVGADKGGEINMFDDFDIDYNQYKYLMEGRCSGALVKPKSALVIEQEVVEAPAG